MRIPRSLFLFCLLPFVLMAQEELPLVLNETFDHGSKAWFPTDAKKWTVDEQEGNRVLHLHGKSDYKPPVRSPHSITLLKNQVFGDFVLTARVKTLQTTRGHRDMCIFFGWQDPAHFYYVHLGEKPDPNSSQIFIVNNEPRTKITETPDVGVPWSDDGWHQVKVVRKVVDGLIEIYFDDMEKPQKVAHDQTFGWGMIGLGSFDDLGLWDDVKIWGTSVEGKKAVLPTPTAEAKNVEKPSAAKASGTDKITADASQDGHPPAHVLDGNPNTKWAANGKGRWIQVELEGPKELSEIGIGFVAGERDYAFEIRTSLDGEKWSAAKAFQSEGKGEAVRAYAIEKTKAQFVRIVVNGSNQNNWANIHTLQIPGMSRLIPSERLQGVAEAKDLVFTKWSADLNVPDPVAISLDHQGRAYVTQTQRRKAQDLDIRQNRDWIPNDVGFESVEEKRAFYLDTLKPENSEANKMRVQDLNGDGSHDYRDLMVLSEKIHRLEDTDGDGFADHMQLYAEDFATEVTGIAAGVLWHNDEVYSTVAPDVWRMRDTNGDGAVDEREVMSTGFGLHIAYAGHDMHGLTIGPDGKIYWSVGDKGISVTTAEGKRFHYPNQGGVMRCNPDGSNFEVYAHGLRNVQELAFDEFGDLFGVDNDADFSGEKERFVYIVPGMDAGWRCNYQYRGADYNPWMAEGLWEPRHEGRPAYTLAPICSYIDGPCGFAYNPGTALGAGWEKTFFLTEAPGGKQYAFQVEGSGAGFEMVNSRQVGNGIPITGLSFGPDGGLYATDWGGGYPLTKSGAVWKIDVAKEDADGRRAETTALLAKDFGKEPAGFLIKFLGHADQRVRLKAQFELVECDDWNALWGGFKESGKNRLARIHGIWGLGQIVRKGKPTSARDRLLATLNFPDSECVVQTLRTLRDLPLGTFDSKSVAAFLDDPEPRVIAAAGHVMRKHPFKAAFDSIVAQLEKNGGKDLYLRHALIQGLVGVGGAESLTKHESEEVRLAAVLALRESKDAAVARFLRDASEAVATEAALAIHDDFSIQGGLEPLSASLANAVGRPEAFVRRAINANFRLGGKEHARRVVEYSEKTGASVSLRLTALRALREWTAPSEFDLVTGRIRKFGARSLDAARLQPNVERLLQDSAPEIQAAAMDLARTHGMTLDTTVLSKLVGNKTIAGPVRLAALEIVSKDESLAEAAMITALSSEIVGLRVRGLELLVKQNPVQAKASALKMLSSDTDRDRQSAVKAFAALKETDEVTELVRSLVAGNLKGAIKLEVMEAGQTLGVEEGLSALLAVRGDIMNPASYHECLEGGDAERGKSIFMNHIAAQCIRCHKVADGKGSVVGPNLKKVAEKGREYVLEALVAPQKTIANGYGNISLTLKDGKTVAGQFRKETETEVILRDPASRKETKFAKTEIADRTPVLSVMPPIGAVLQRHELRDVLAYLMTLKSVD